jgi:hypothetical protein
VRAAVLAYWSVHFVYSTRLRMDQILAWPPVIWTARILLVTIMGGSSYVLWLLMARFLRPKNVLELLKAEPPKLDEVGGEFAGAKASVKFAAQGEALKTLTRRVKLLEGQIETLRVANVDTVDGLMEGSNDED